MSAYTRFVKVRPDLLVAWSAIRMVRFVPMGPDGAQQAVVLTLDVSESDGEGAATILVVGERADEIWDAFHRDVQVI